MVIMEKKNQTKKAPKTILIIGLGNPGKEYYYTRHSLGFMVADAFAKKHGFPDFAMVEDNTMSSAGNFAGKTVILAKPQTFMNQSGYRSNDCKSIIPCSKAGIFPAFG